MTSSLLRKFRAAILPRRSAAVLLLFLLAAAALWAQYRSKRPAAHALRALGVLEWPASGASAPRLVPLIILADGKYYDATIYLASPVPLAVEPGTLYEGQQSGVPKGLFTINAAQELTATNIWYGQGAWAEGATGTYGVAPREEDRPVLRRAKPDSESAPASGPGTPPPQAPTQQQVESDPNRPMLQRGKPPAPAPAPAPSPAAPAAKPATPAPATPAPAPTPPAAPRWMVAVSDAQPAENRSFVLTWSAGEKDALTKRAVALAQAEIAKYTIMPGGQHAVPGPLTDLQARFFDVNSDNAPEVVLSARQPAGSYAAPAAQGSRKAGSKRAAPRSAGPQAQPDIYITLVARGDLDGNLRRIFVSITDGGRLDAVPRLELIDAVDADGRGVGQLLFHKIGRGPAGLEGNVVLYRVDPDQLTELFDSWVQ